MLMNQTDTKIFHIVTWVLMTSLILTSLPSRDVAAAVVRQGTKKTQPKFPPPPANVKVNRTIPKVTPVSAFPVFSPDPKDEEIMRARVFEEPLVPMGAGTSVEENRALADAVLSY